jgi:KaiC/GvpD/RAD55 family RecA-like ATPase
MERISTGINGLDERLAGGYPTGRSILIIGESGSGKTLLCLHFIKQACKDGRKCIYIATEEAAEDLLSQSESIDQSLQKYFDSGILTIKRVYEKRAEEVEHILELGIEEIDSKRTSLIDVAKDLKSDCQTVVIDNIGVFALHMSPYEFRAQMDALTYHLNKKQITALLVMDEYANQYTGQIASYSTYGTIHLGITENPYTNKRERYLEIKKMRNTPIDPQPLLFDITNHGITLLEAK